jgi:phosphatidylserine decarboxylase
MKIHKEGIQIIIGNTLIWIIFAILFWWLSDNTIINWIATSISTIMTIFVLTFFRVPYREPIYDSNIVVSPGDGKVVNICRTEENEYFKGECIQISIFLSFFNVHVTWYPVGGEISYYKYHPGKYLFAFLPKASEKNERTTIAVKTECGTEVMFRQIAGIVARRIVCYSETGTECKQADQAGFIKFGSRLDIFLPLDAEIIVKKGDKVTGQLSQIAKIK